MIDIVTNWKSSTEAREGFDSTESFQAVNLIARSTIPLDSPIQEQDIGCLRALLMTNGPGSRIY